MHVTIVYFLSEKGRKAALLAGLPATKEQRLRVENTDPAWAEVVARAAVHPDGTATWEACYGQNVELDAPVASATELIAARAAAEAARAAAQEEAARARAAAHYDRTLAAVRERRQEERFLSYHDEQFVYHRPLLPAEPDEGVMATPEAREWLAQLQAEEAAANIAYENFKAAAIAAAAIKDEQEKAARRERRSRLGLEPGDLTLRIEDGALAQVPEGCWESHSRGKNWLAVIATDPSSPGGLQRTFAEKAKGDSFYLLPAWQPGTAVEFGADYYSGSGRKNAKRWYGYFLREVEDDDVTYAVLRHVASGKAACKEGAAWAKVSPPADPALHCDQCSKPQWDDGSGLCSWRACAETGSCDGRQKKESRAATFNAEGGIVG